MIPMFPMIPLFLTYVHDDADRDFLIECYKQHRYTMLYVAKSVLHDEFLAEDAVQEAFCRVARNIQGVRKDTNEVRAYLVTIVRNIAIDMQRKKKWVSLDEIDYEAEDPVNLEEFTEQRVAAKDAEDMILALPSKYSTVFLLRYKHDCSDKNIADLMGISEAAIRKRLQRAREMVAEIVREIEERDAS